MPPSPEAKTPAVQALTNPVPEVQAPVVEEPVLEPIVVTPPAPVRVPNTPLTLRKIPADLPRVVADRDTNIPVPYGAFKPDAVVAAPQPMPGPINAHARAPAQLRSQAHAHYQQVPNSKPKKRQLKFHLVMAGIFGALTVGSFVLGFVWSIIAPDTDAWASFVAVCWLLAVVQVVVWIIWGIARR